MNTMRACGNSARGVSFPCAIREITNRLPVFDQRVAQQDPLGLMTTFDGLGIDVAIRGPVERDQRELGLIVETDVLEELARADDLQQLTARRSADPQRPREQHGDAGRR